ncbi:MAG: energy transducer TonB [Planctomycetes bacterium]|nr:energy transducer TonB [Planctomycetota bacterium]
MKMRPVPILLLVLTAAGGCRSAAAPASDPRPLEATAPMAEVTRVDGGIDLGPAARRQPTNVSPAPASARRPKPVFEGTGVLVYPKPIAEQCARPDYPRDARLEGREGEVVVRASVDANGVVVETAVERSSGHRDLDLSACRTAANWVFTPGTWRGERVELDVLLPFEFHLKDPKRPRL